MQRIKSEYMHYYRVTAGQKHRRKMSQILGDASEINNIKTSCMKSRVTILSVLNIMCQYQSGLSISCCYLSVLYPDRRRNHINLYRLALSYRVPPKKRNY